MPPAAAARVSGRGTTESHERTPAPPGPALAARSARLPAVIKYLGSKRVLLPRILDEVAGLAGVRTVLDLFSGTSRVGHALKARGYRVHANDHNAYAATLAVAYVQSDRRRWMEPARRLIAELDVLRGRPGWFTETFCVRSRYLQPENGARVDAIRERGARVNASCGLHVTIEWNGDAASLARLISLVGNHERAIFASTGTRRREQTIYTKRIKQYGDKVRWVSTKPEVSNFRLLIHRPVEAADAPRNPFGATGDEPAEWTAKDGKVELGPPLPNAKGYEYKFTIEIADGKHKLDPHIIFEGRH